MKFKARLMSRKVEPIYTPTGKESTQTLSIEDAHILRNIYDEFI